MLLDWKGRTYQVLQNTSLLVVCLVCYVLLIVLYLSPKSYNIRSLVYPEPDAVIQPSAVVGIIATVLSGATSALVTRAVEQSSWITLWDNPKQYRESLKKKRAKLISWLTGTRSPLTFEEVHRLAGWSTSPWDCLLYIFGNPRDRSLLLYVTGPSLLATAALVSPILLLGISQAMFGSAMVLKTINHTENPWLTRLTLPPHLDYAKYTNDSSPDGKPAPLENVAFPMGDYLAELAALSAMSNQTPKAISAPCDNALMPSMRGKGNATSCQLKARTVHIRATCRASDLPNPDGLRVIPEHGNRTAYVCAGNRTDELYWSNLCAKVGAPDDDPTGRNIVYSNFQTGQPSV